jgi:vacuolar-type H+-ATPase subunit H
MAKFNANEINRKIREAQRKAEQQLKREVDRVNRANKKVIDDYNRKANSHNKKVISDYNKNVQDYNRKANVHNLKVIAELNRQLRSSSGTIRYTQQEEQLADRVYNAISTLDSREYDTFLSYARIDGSDTAEMLRSELEKLGVSVWFDEVSIIPGKSQSLQMDAGLRKARSGIALLTPAYLAGRFWTERELGALLSKDTLIPVLHMVTFNDVKQYSGILPDLAGFTTQNDTIQNIARKIAAAILVVESE